MKLLLLILTSVGFIYPWMFNDRDFKGFVNTSNISVDTITRVIINLLAGEKILYPNDMLNTAYIRLKHCFLVIQAICQCNAILANSRNISKYRTK